MEREYEGHVLVIPYPLQGHMNPMFQFAKRLASKRHQLRVTFVTTKYISTTTTTRSPRPSAAIHLETISDGFDSGGFSQAESIRSYLSHLESEGSKTLSDVIIKYKHTEHPVTCIIYDSFLSWTLEVAKKFDLLGAPFFTQPCAVNYIYYLVHHGHLKLPLTQLPVVVTGLPPLQLRDMPAYIYVAGSYPAYFELVLHQFINAHQADFLLVNTFYKLETQILDTMTKVCPQMITIGPTIPSIYLDNRVDDDQDYDLHLFDLDPHNDITTWLRAKPPRSVVFVSFGSMAVLSSDQMEELAWGLHGCGYSFLWVVRESEESKIPQKFKDGMGPDRGLIVRWSRQPELLSSSQVGCFFSHGGWNSTIEALSLGVPMVVMPQWADQTTNAKLVEDVWKIGVRVSVGEDGIVRREEIQRCIKAVMEDDDDEIRRKENASKWKELALEAVSDGGTSNTNINHFISNIILKKCTSF